jgi:hypothetical protein
MMTLSPHRQAQWGINKDNRIKSPFKAATATSEKHGQQVTKKRLAKASRFV